MICIYLEVLEYGMKYLSSKSCCNSESLRFRKRKVHNQEPRVPAELCGRTTEGSVVSEVRTLLSGLSLMSYPDGVV